TYTDLNYHYDVSYSYDYYDGSNRLKSRESQEVEDWSPLTDNVDGFMKIGVGDKKAYQYDKAGNMTAKGNSYSFNGNGVDYSEVDGENIAYWKYGYNSKNRLTDVWKNGGDEGSHIAKYGYDYRGLRVRVEEGDAVSYHVYNYFGQLVYEEQGDEETFYIYALGRVIAKREGKSGEEEKVYYYHHDNLGSTVLMIDTEGEVVFEQEYAPFGQDLHKAGTYEKSPYDVEAGMKYTGQIADVDTGLYYYNARYYDPEIGRFNREDEYHGDVFRPQGLNPYVYVLNNALKYVDPSGNIGINISSTDGGGIATEEDAREFEDYWNSVFKPEEFFGYDKTALEIYKDKILNRFVEFENTAALIDEWFVRHNKTPTGYWWNEGYSNDEAVDFEWIGGGFRIIVNVVVFEGKADIITFNSKHLDKYTLSHFDTNSFIILSSNHGISSGQVEVFTGDILKSLKKQGIKIKDLLNHKPLMAKSLKNALGSSASINLIGISKEVNTPPISLKDYIDTSHNILNISANVLNFRVSLDYSDKLEIEGVGWVWKPVPVVLDINNTSKMYHWIIPILVEED
ncbi:MAG: hypothetical protein KAX49_19690, partial [Halanaerobiales bacterium]|nr:hypothetical protein [Halanaerobiales bacterium]